MRDWADEGRLATSRTLRHALPRMATMKPAKIEGNGLLRHWPASENHYLGNQSAYLSPIQQEASTSRTVAWPIQKPLRTAQISRLTSGRRRQTARPDRRRHLRTGAYQGRTREEHQPTIAVLKRERRSPLKFYGIHEFYVEQQKRIG
jgi:hypothetical protein